MPARSLLLLLALTLAGMASGCAHRLTGPNHAADGPPWLAEDAPPVARVPALEIAHRVVLIGDAGYFLEDDPTLAALDDWATAVDSASVVFLGDNIYNEGLTDEDRAHGEKILGQQLAATEVRKIVIPGNHDWGLFPRDYNMQSIDNQQAFVDEWPAGHAEFIPKDGCMGPSTRVLLEGTDDTPAVVFIALDPTPWIQERLREYCPRPEGAAEDPKALHLAGLAEALERHAGDRVILASHYPMLTGGPHGGYSYGFLAELILGPLRLIAGGFLDTYETDYADWIAQAQTIMRDHPPAIYAAGHDHNLQLLESGDVAGLYVVSGAGARDRVSTVTHIEETIFAHAAEGFVVVDFGRTEAGRETTVVRIIEPLVSVDAPVYEYALP
ncbi:MAG: metallophosphoesterase [Myxococcota bacterium]